ncbi:MAG: hypothetical protein KTR29_07870, partial [Rhodothermaceae bacterium]|nr:hypothetical protein [Rhodothermaceae bacterium]
MGTPLSRASLVLTLALVGAFVLFIPPATADGLSVSGNHSVLDSTAAPVTLSLGNLNLGVAAFDARSGTGYIMYSEESVHIRFASTPPSQWNADHLIAVVFVDNQWFIDNNEFALVPFTPRMSDRLLVEVDFGANTVTSLEGITTTTNAITTGYISSDLLVTPEVWGGDPDEGEFWIQGTEVTVEGSTPTVEILEGPAADSTITYNDPLFAWTASDLDGSVTHFFIDLVGPSPDSLTLSDTLYQFSDLSNGDYTFCVTAQDNNSNSSSAACRSFSVNFTPSNELPTLQITDGPEDGGTIGYANPLFAWSAEDTDGTVDSFFVELSGPTPDSFSTTETTIQFEALLNGEYAFCVQALDNAGGLSDAACRSFTVLFNVAPTVQITNGPADSTVIAYNNPAFTWEGEDVDGIITSFLVSLEGPSPDSFATTNTFIQYAARENGDYSFCVQAIDDNNAVSDSTCRFFTIDIQTQNTAPVVTINNGPEEGSTLNYNNPAFLWSGEDTDGAIDSFHVELRGPSFTTFSTQGTFHQFSDLLNGDHEFCIRASDNEALFSSWECRSFSVFVTTSNVPPTVTIENGPAQGDSLLFNNPAFSWSGEDIDGTVDSFLVDLQGPTPVQFNTIATFQQFNALDNGAYSFCIQAQDDLGALSEQLCRDFVLVTATQNEIPTVTIENGPEDGSTITFNNPAFSWAGEDTDGAIEAYTVDLIGPTPMSFSTSDTFFQFPPLASGAYSFCIQALDDKSALSSWVCRQFNVNSAITGSLKDLVISQDGAILQIPLVQESIKIYQSDVFIESRTTDGQGGFSILGQYGQGNYQLITEFTETIEGIDAPVSIQHTLPIVENEALDILVTKSMAVDQFETLSRLSNHPISSALFDGEPGNVSIGPLYNLEQLESQLRAWLGSLTFDN